MARIRPRNRIAARRRVTRSGRLPLWPFALLAAVGAIWWASQAGTADEPASAARVANVPAPVAGTRTLESSLVVCIAIDESSSTERSDPAGLRHTESEAIANWMSSYSGNKDDRFCAVRFSSAADGLAPVPVSEAGSALAGLFGTSTASLGGGTSLGPAVDRIADYTAPYSNARRVAILLTDGQLDDQQELPRTLAALRSSVDSVYLIGLDGDGAWSMSTHRLYEHRGLTQVLTLGSVRNDALAKALARIILRETGQRAGGKP